MRVLGELLGEGVPAAGTQSRGVGAEGPEVRR